MHLTPAICSNPNCGDQLSIAAISCAGCGNQHVGYPNVRYADDVHEIEELERRVDEAQRKALSNGSASTLAAFESAAGSSCAITVMMPSDLLSILGDNRLWTSYYKHSRRYGGRIPAYSKWDTNRGANDSKINPEYYEELNFAVLSLTNHGCSWYGGCHVKLDSDRIASRASVFWENPFQFLKKVALEPDEIVPAGYRASWIRRGKLAVAKLHEKIRADTPEAEFHDIILERDATRPDTDFIEVHIYGPVSSSTFAAITVNTWQFDSDDLFLWESVKRRLDKRGIPTDEINDG